MFRRHWPILLILSLTALLDLAGRVLLRFDFGQVVLLEAVLLPLAGLALHFCSRRPACGPVARRRIGWLAVFLILGGMRAAALSAGLAIFWAKLGALCTGAIAWMLYLGWRRRSR